MAGSSPKQQAAQAAQGAVPTVGSINRQYGQSISDVEGFTTALAKLLGGMPSAQGAYNTAIQQQGGIDSAAQHALGVTGTPYAAGSQAAAAGFGASALSNLNARGAAAGAYAATLPHVAAARGTLGVQTLESAKQNALQTRNDAYKQAYLSALAQARQNQEQMRQFGITTRINQQQFAANQQYQYAALQQNQNQFKQTQALQWQEFMAKAKASVSGGTAPGLAGYTPSEISGLQRRAYGILTDPQSGVAAPNGPTNIVQSIRELQAQGVPRAIALYEAQAAYGNLTPPPAAFKQSHPAQYTAAMNAYKAAIRSLRMWVAQRRWAKQHPDGAPSSNQPIRPGP